MRSSKWMVLCGVATTLLLLSGCSAFAPAEDLAQTAAPTFDHVFFDSTEEGARWALEQGYDRVAEQLADGVVTADEYEEAYRTHVSCQEKAGWTFSDTAAVWNPVDHRKLMRWGVAPAGLDPDVALACDKPFDYLDSLFQTTATPRMDPQLVPAIQACLEKAGIPYSPDGTNLPELVGPEAGSSPDNAAISTCVTDETLRLYPDLPGFSVAF